MRRDSLLDFTSSAHADNIERAEALLRAAMPSLKQAAQLNAGKAADLRQRQSDAQLQQLQSAINTNELLHYGCSSLTSSPPPARLLHLHSVQYHSLACSGTLAVPICKCSACDATFILPAAAVGCVESSVTNPSLWFDSTLLLFYHSLRHRSGVSVASFTGSLNDRFKLFPWQYPAGSDMAHVLDDRRVRECYRLSRVLFDPFDDMEQLLNQHGAELNSGVIGRCRICSNPQPLMKVLAADEVAKAERCLHAACAQASAPAIVTATTTATAPPTVTEPLAAAPAAMLGPSDAPLLPPRRLPDYLGAHPWAHPGRRPFYAMADGNMKLNHHAKCGKTTAEVFKRRGWLPMFTRYFGIINQHIDRLLTANGGTSSSDEVSCAAHISAARAHSSSTQGPKEVDIRCTIGGCDTHGPAVSAQSQDHKAKLQLTVAKLERLLGLEVTWTAEDQGFKVRGGHIG